MEIDSWHLGGGSGGVGGDVRGDRWGRGAGMTELILNIETIPADKILDEKVRFRISFLRK